MITLSVDQKDPAKMKELGDNLNSLAHRLRVRRLFQIEVWLKNYSAWRATYTRSFYRSDTFNHYVPQFRRTIEKFVTNGAQILMPSNDFFEVFPLDVDDPESGKRAESVMSYLSYLLRKRVRMYPVVKQLLRTYALYGRSIVKTSVRVMSEHGKDMVWPHLRAVDPFMFLVYPETVTNIDDALIVVEDSIMPWDQYEALATRAGAKVIPKDKLGSVSWPHYVVRRLQQSGIGTPPSEASGSANYSGGTTSEMMSQKDTGHPYPYEWVFLSEIWVNDGTGWKYSWVVVNGETGPEVVKISSKRFQRPCFRWVVAREAPGEQYTSSPADDLEPLQILLNDQVNMFLESQALGFAPPTAVDPNLVTRSSSLVYRPRAKWLVPPAAVQVLQNSGEQTSRAALQGINWSMGLMEQLGGSSPLAQGQTTRNLPRAGFAVSSLLSMSLSDIRDVCRTVEDEILTPGLHDLYALTVEYVPAGQLFKIPGTKDFPGRVVVLRDMEGDYDFNWTGSMQSQDNQQKAQKFISFIGELSKLLPIMAPDLATRGMRLNWAGILKRLWRDGLGERGADTLIENVGMPGTPNAPAVPQFPNNPMQQQDQGGGQPDLQQLMAMMQQGQGDQGGQ